MSRGTTQGGVGGPHPQPGKGGSPVWVFRQLRPFYTPFLRTLYVTVGFLGLFTALTLITPYLTKALINSVLTNHHWVELAPLVLALPLLNAASGAVSFAQQYLSQDFGQKVTFQLRQALYARLQYHGFEYYDREHTGNLMQRLTGDVEAWRTFWTQGIIEVASFCFNVVFGIIVMLTLNPLLTLLTLLLLPFLTVVVMRFDSSVRPGYSRIRQSMSELQTTVQENITGVRTVKAFAREDFAIEGFEARSNTFMQTNIDVAVLQSRYIPAMQFIGNVGTVVLLWVGGLEVLHHQMTLGAMVAFFGLLGYLTGPIQQLGFLVNLFAQAVASGQRLLEILETPDIVRAGPEAVELTPDQAKGHVRFEHVSFQYPEPGATEPNLHNAALIDVSFDAPPGTVTALLGRTGSGKSTLVNLIPRFYEAQQGVVQVDGRNVRKWTVASLRRQIGVVPGETFLFSASIFENISYGKRSATLEEVRAAATMAQADDFIMELPEQYQTIVGERGLGLSGGQRQRIALARAILYDPRILILDDATSSVDLETEYLIQTALERIMAGRTTFIIAHRVSSLRRADQILVMDGGRVVDQGRHEELLERSGLYREVYALQFNDQDRAETVGGPEHA